MPVDELFGLLEWASNRRREEARAIERAHKR
jgi:hypothetical protein